MVRRVAVIGAGLMGHGIAGIFALAGFPVRLCDTSPDRLEAALRSIAEELGLLAGEGLVGRSEADAATSRIEPTTELERAVAGADVVTEAIPEVLPAKLELLERIEAAVPPTTLVASNTSTFPVTRLAERARLPGRMVVTHYFNPPHLVPLVEVHPHPAAPPEMAVAALDLMRRIGKRPVLVRKEVPGLIANRLQAAMVREAFHLLEEGVADAEDIDAAVTEGPGFRWPFLGPLAVADYGGLEVWQKVVENLVPHLGRSEVAPPAIAERVRRGDLGTKTGKGIYSYAGASVPDLVRQRDRRLVALLKLKAVWR
jgi:3-hydroxyacyl-CoA dehydrogenase